MGKIIIGFLLAIISQTAYSTPTLPWQSQVEKFLGCYDVVSKNGETVKQTAERETRIMHTVQPEAGPCNLAGEDTPFLWVSVHYTTPEGKTKWDPITITPELSQITSTPQALQLKMDAERGWCSFYGPMTIRRDKTDIDFSTIDPDTIAVKIHQYNYGIKNEYIFKRKACTTDRGNHSTTDLILKTSDNTKHLRNEGFEKRFPQTFAAYKYVRIDLSTLEIVRNVYNKILPVLSYSLRSHPASMLYNASDYFKVGSTVELGIFYDHHATENELFDTLNEVLQQYFPNLKFETANVTFEGRFFGETEVNNIDFLYFEPLKPIVVTSAAQWEVHLKMMKEWITKLQATKDFDQWKTIIESNPQPGHVLDWSKVTPASEDVQFQYRFTWYSDPNHPSLPIYSYGAGIWFGHDD